MFLDDLKNVNKLHKIELLRVSDYQKKQNKKSIVKNLYKIKIEHDKNNGIFFTEYAKKYHDIIEKLYKKYNNKSFITGTTEQGNILIFDIAYICNNNKKVED